MKTNHLSAFALALACLLVLATLAACSNPSGPSNPNDTDDPVVQNPTGNWMQENGSDYLVLRGDGTAETPKYTGTWTTLDGRLYLQYTTEMIDGLRVPVSGSTYWYYTINAELLYKDSPEYPFIRSGSDTGLAGSFERVEFREGLDWVKVSIAFTPETFGIRYSMYTNVDGDYDESTGTGTWAADPLFELTGTVSELPVAKASSVSTVYIRDITPPTSEFPEQDYVFTFFTNDSFSIDCSGMVAFTSSAESPEVYAAGYCVDTAGTMIPGYWLNGSWVQLPALNSGEDAVVNAIWISESIVYAGGWCKDTSGVKIGGYWTNGIWTSLPSAVPGQDSEVLTLHKEEGTGLSLSGYQINAEGRSLPFTTIVSGADTSSFYPYPLASIDNDASVHALYWNTVEAYMLAGGRNEAEDGKSAAGYWRYDKNAPGGGLSETIAWVPLNGIDGIEDYTITDVFSQDNIVYAYGYGVGTIGDQTGVIRTVYWIDGVPLEEQTKYANEPSRSSEMEVVNGHVYTASTVTSTISGTYAALRKNGLAEPESTFDISLPSLVESKASGATSLAVHNGFVYTGGYSTDKNDRVIPGYWVGGTWVSLPRISDLENGFLLSLFIVN